MRRNPHNYAVLLDQWKSLARANDWKSTELCSDGPFPVVAMENKAARGGGSGGLYISAGVHGDECAPVWALLDWAKGASADDKFADRPLVIFPCLNPYGLTENTRVDSRGSDLNRSFQDPNRLVVGQWQKFLGNRRFEAALNLHEDYDAGGIYLYELTRSQSLGESLLAACESIIPRETADNIDGSEMENGLLNRSLDVESIANEELGGWPEAIWIFLKLMTDSYTFETPSELDLERRIEAQRRFIETLVAIKFS